ncbi:MAG TPA: hypothetical protein VKV33_09205, partial [Streptosporangiaceae bacterium]|nr:hypothetical protein [Streptosporangiaceae bacterium]
CYKQLNSSVGEFGTDTLEASTRAMESSSAGDGTYRATDRALSALELARDRLAETIKGELSAAASADHPVRGAALQTAACQAIISGARHLASGS